MHGLHLLAVHAVGALKKTLANRAIQVFGLFRDFGEQPDGEPQEQKRENRGAGQLCPVNPFSPSQNLSEIPPRTERRLVLSWVNSSPLSVLGWTSSRLRASRTASA